jgi:uroporphyrinogen-III synthase
MSEHPSAVQQPNNQTAHPLAGWRVVVTRSEEQSDSLVEQLAALGAEPLPYPTIMIVPPDNIAPLDDALRQMVAGGYDWLILTSVNAVHVVAQRLTALGLAVSTDTPPCKVAAVGSTTNTACHEVLGLQPAVVPKKFVAESLAEALGDMQGQRVLLANADISRPILQERLQEAGAIINRVVAYCTVPATGGVDLPRLLHDKQVDAITFTSGSTIRYFIERVGQELLATVRQTVIVCIGPIAADTAVQVGLPPTIVANTYTEQGLIDALVEYATKQQVKHSARQC